jgi:hypothetical protein
MSVQVAVASFLIGTPLEAALIELKCCLRMEAYVVEIE